jgi:nicotinamide mononucleotide transporter
VDWLEWCAVVTGIISVYLSVKQKISSWPIALVNVALYFEFFRETGFYSGMWLQAIYFVLSLYGWYEWLYGGKNRTELKVSRTTLREAVIVAGLTALGAVVGAALVVRYTTNPTFPYLDSALTAASIAAQWMMTRKLLENWGVWIAVNLLYIGMFIATHHTPTAALYIGYVVLAVMGHMQWRRSYRAELAASPAAAAA